jgi:hypothetical protein
MNRAAIITVVVLVLLAVLVAWPVKQRCGNPRYTCATAPDAQGNIHYSYAVIPLGVSVLERVSDVDLPSIRYSEGTETEAG